MQRSILGKVAGRCLAVLAAASAAIAAPAAAPIGEQWVADPDSQFLLDVEIGRLTLGDQIRAYQTPEGTCLVLGDALTALDVPMKIDLQARRASGWAFREDNKIDIDLAAGTVLAGAARETLKPGDIRETGEGWCVDSAALGRWLHITATPETSNSMLRIASETKLPIQMRVERREKAKKIGRPAESMVKMASLPQIRLPYRLWRAPALDFVVNAGATYSAGSGVRLSRSAAIYAAGELAAMSYVASVSTDSRGLPNALWARLYRSDPDAGLLGPLKATHLAIGDVSGRQSAMGSAGENGRGLMVTNRPLANPSSFDRTEFQGELPQGWDAELYRNGSLLAFDGDEDGDGRYHFADVELRYGENDFEIILYGPQGQVQKVNEAINVGRDNVPPGQLWYWAGVRQPGTKLFEFGKKAPPDETTPTPSKPKGIEAVVEAQMGLSERLSVAALVRSSIIDDERVTYVEGAARHSFGAAMVEAAASIDGAGRLAGRAQVIARIGEATLSAGTFLTNGLASVLDADDDGGSAGPAKNRGTARVRTERVSAAVPIKLGKQSIPVSADVSRSLFSDHSTQIEAAATIGARFGNFNLSNRTSYARRSNEPSAKIDTELIGTARVGKVRLRGGARWQVLPEKRFNGAQLDANWASGERTQWEAGVTYAAKNVRGRVSHIRQFDALALAVTGEAGSDGSVAAGVSVNFSLDPARTGFRTAREKLASKGSLHATIYEDLNENGQRDSDEPFLKNAMLTTGKSASETGSDEKGQLFVPGLTPYVPVVVSIDQSSLDNPALAPAVPAQVVVPRPGVSANIEIGLVGGGSAEGFAVRSDGRPIEGLDIELVGEDGTVLASARSDMDGYFLFERVRYGNYTLRLTAASAAAIGARQKLAAQAVLTRGQPLARLGAIEVTMIPTIAVAEAPVADPAETATTNVPATALTVADAASAGSASAPGAQGGARR